MVDQAKGVGSVNLVVEMVKKKDGDGNATGKPCPNCGGTGKQPGNGQSGGQPGDELLMLFMVQKLMITLLWKNQILLLNRL